MIIVGLVAFKTQTLILSIGSSLKTHCFMNTALHISGCRSAPYKLLTSHQVAGAPPANPAADR